MQHCCAMLGHVTNLFQAVGRVPVHHLGDFQRQVPLWMPMTFTTPIFISQFCVARQKINGAVFVSARSILEDDESIQVFMNGSMWQIPIRKPTLGKTVVLSRICLHFEALYTVEHV